MSRWRRAAFALLALCASAPGASAQLERITDPNFFCSGDPCVVTTALDISGGAFVSFGSRHLIIQAEIDAGTSFASLSAGRLSVLPGGQFRARGTLGNAGGEFELLIQGDIELQTGSDWAFLLEGDSGGELTLESETGSIRGSGRIINAHALGSGEDGGTLAITALGGVDLTGWLRADGGPDGGLGGDLEIVSGADVQIGGLGGITSILDLSGGGDLTIESDGEVVIREVDLSGVSGSGGTLTVVADASIQLLADLDLNGALAGGGNSGGVVDLDAGFGEILIGPSAVLTLNGQGARGCGGDVTFDALRVRIEGEIQANGRAAASCGGSLDLFAAESITVSGAGIEAESGDSSAFLNPLDPNGPLPGAALIDLVSLGSIDVLAAINADARLGSDGPAGAIDLDARGPLHIAARVSASGAPGGFGGTVLLQGCTVTTTGTAEIEARRALGEIAVLDGDQMTLSGSFLTGGDFGSIRLLHAGKLPILAASFNPNAEILFSDGLPNCDLDADGVLNFEDNCPRAANPLQEDRGGVGFLAAPGEAGDGIGDVCQCGDVSDDGAVLDDDLRVLRQALAGTGPGLVAAEKCHVWPRSPASLSPRDPRGLPPDCDRADATLLERNLAGLGPGIEPVCAAAQGATHP